MTIIDDREYLSSDQIADHDASWEWGTDTDDWLGSPGSVLTPCTPKTPSSVDRRPRSELLIGKYHFLNATQTALLHLNDACRAQEWGAFYMMPERTNLQFGHPCDLVYLPDSWEEQDKLTWDHATSIEKIGMCQASRSAYQVSRLLLIVSSSSEGQA